MASSAVGPSSAAQLLAGRYRLLRGLGEGAAGEVFAAVRCGPSGFARLVALKVLRRNHAPSGAIARAFAAEACIASRLRHRGLVAIEDFGFVGDRPFVAMELVDGVDLLRLRDRAAARRLRMPEEVALHVALEVALALHHAHLAASEAGTPLDLVHRDVSPRNVLVGWDGAVKLTDFGVAAWRGRALEPTPHGALRGTLGYMAPERVLGNAATARSDVFSLGCLLHFLLAGKTPLRRGRLLAFVTGRETLTLARGLPDDLRAILERATARDPAQRYGSAEAMAVDLNHALAARSAGERFSRAETWLAQLREPSDTIILDDARETPGVLAVIEASPPAASPEPPAPRGAGATAEGAALATVGVVAVMLLLFAVALALWEA